MEGFCEPWFGGFHPSNSEAQDTFCWSWFRSTHATNRVSLVCCEALAPETQLQKRWIPSTIHQRVVFPHQSQPLMVVNLEINFRMMIKNSLFSNGLVDSLIVWFRRERPAPSRLSCSSGPGLRRFRNYYLRERKNIILTNSCSIVSLYSSSRIMFLHWPVRVIDQILERILISSLKEEMINKTEYWRQLISMKVSVGN